MVKPGNSNESDEKFQQEELGGVPLMEWTKLQEKREDSRMTLNFIGLIFFHGGWRSRIQF